jgi:peptide/nickel transport system permease protein
MASLWRFILGRAASAVLTLFGVSVVIFFAIRMVPGKFEEVLIPRGTPEFRAALAEKLGLDQPLFIQYAKWVGHLLQGDFGLSLITSRPVWEEFAARIPVTGEIALLATLVALTIGVPLGIFAGLSRSRRGVATASRLFTGVTLSVPDFVLGSVLLYLVSRYSFGLTVGDYVPLRENLFEHLRGIVVPVVTLSFLGIGVVAATSRHASISVAAQDFVSAAVLRGESHGEVIRRHVLRNASIPVVTIISIYLGYLLSGTILVEQLLSVPGFGRYVFQGIIARDYTVVQSGVMLAASFFILLNMLTDVAYAWLDPRMRTGDAT